METCARCNPVNRNSQLCSKCIPLLQTRIDAILERELPQNEGYDSALFVDPVPDHYECSLCMGAFRDPIQIEKCGHVFCKTCLNRATEEEKMCPKHRGEPFTLTFPDQAKKREVLSLKVRCRKEGCSWNGDLSDLYDHLNRNCIKTRLSCLNEGCVEVLLRGDLFDHSNDHCPFRLIRCELCELFVKYNQMMEHRNLVCKRFAVPCRFSCGEKFPRNEVSEHGLVCEKRPLPCVYADFGCSFEAEKTLLSKHLKNDVSGHLKRTTQIIREQDTTIKDLTIKHDNISAKHDNLSKSTIEQIRELQTNSVKQKMIIQDLKSKLDKTLAKNNDHESKYQDLKLNKDDVSTDSKNNLEKFNLSTKNIYLAIFILHISLTIAILYKLNSLFNKHEDLSFEHESLFEKHKNLLTKHDFLLTKHESIATKHHETKAMVETLQKKFTEKHKTFYWRINTYQVNFEEAELIYSPHFYTVDGYKFRLEAILRTHQTILFFQLFKGEHDDRLTWPFNKKMTLSILSQDDYTEDKIKVIVPADEPNPPICFEKPINEYLGICHPILLQYTEIETFIKDDVMLIKCVIEY